MSFRDWDRVGRAAPVLTPTAGFGENPAATGNCTMSYQGRPERRCDLVHTLVRDCKIMVEFSTQKPWSFIVGGAGLIITLVTGFAYVVQHDQSKTDAILTLSQQLVDVTSHLRDIDNKLSAGAAYPVQLQDMDRRSTAVERTLEAITTRLQASDAELVYLRNQSDNSKAAFADIWPRLQQLERKRNER